VNKLTIIGNLTRDPETRTVGADKSVCSFTVAVNRRKVSQNPNQPEADFFRVSAWDKLGENCQRYLAKGRKVAVVGPVSVSSYEAKDGGGTRFSLDMRADDVEFLSSSKEVAAQPKSDADDSGQQYAPADLPDEDPPF
jgi:single-strand DNA-binding protein